jgi:pimeloyl-ACP methyl ester carboxylesterase
MPGARPAAPAVTMTITRHFATVQGRWGTRQVHYRRSGRGPLVLLLHQSPQSSRELEPLMEQWGSSFTVVAPDSPGYGLSDPLGVAEASLDDFAAATIEFMDAIGAGRAGVYGYHTGGMIGIALGHRHPERISAATSNGVAILTPEEREAILRGYLPPLEPRWDGSHLAWLWARMREQAIFFPWHVASVATRMEFAVPPPDRLQAGLLEFLRAGDHYHVAYRAAFVYQADAALAETRTPTLATAAAYDPISPHLQRIPAPAAAVTVVLSETPSEALDRCQAHLAAHPGDGLGPPPGPAPVPDRLWSDLVRTGAGYGRLFRGGPPGEVPVVVLHGAGGSAVTVRPLAESLARYVPVLAPDLPGHGEWTGESDGPRLTDLSQWFQDLCQSLGLEKVHLVAPEGAAAIGLSLALNPRCAHRVGRLALVNPHLPGESQRTVARAGINRDGVDWYGGHLLRAWHTVRDGRLFYPWCQRDPAGIRRHEPRLDPRDIHREATELLKAEDRWQSLMEDQLDYPVAVRAGTPALAGRLLLAAAPGWPGQVEARTLAEAAGLPMAQLEPEPDRWGGSIAPFLAVVS